MPPDQQLVAIGRLHDRFEGHGIDYWLFGGWAVDFHAGRRTRTHADIDVAIWRTDLAAVDRVLRQEDWTRVPQPGEDGYTQYENGSLHLDLAFLARDGDGLVYTPLADGRGDWPAGSFGDEVAALGDVRARVVELPSLIADKSEDRTDPETARKDAADIAVLGRIQKDG
jgi:hypothetical protein